MRGQKNDNRKKEVRQQGHCAYFEGKQLVQRAFAARTGVGSFYGLHDIDPPWSI